MGYNASYEEGDIADSIMNFFVKLVIVFSFLIPIIIIIVLYKVFKDLKD